MPHPSSHPLAGPTETPANIDAVDARLLDRVQRGIPLEPRPFATLGEELGISEADCVTRLERLRGDGGVIRQISAIFDTQALGYASSLVAAKIPADRVEEAAAVISRHPGVSHNYLRGHAFNLWFTLAVPPDSRLGLDGTLEKLNRQSGAESMRALPTLRLFKIGVKLKIASDDETDTSSDPATLDASPPPAFTEADRETAAAFTLDERDKRMILALQQDLPLTPRPFDAWATQADCTVNDLLTAAKRFVERRQMRRFSAVLRHRKAGYDANVMTVWRCPETEIERCGQIMAQSEAVSHCYRRPTYPDWPYALYTMVHGRSREECLATLASLQTRAGLGEYLPLWSLREFKKVRVRYFTPETAEWERLED